MKGRLLGTLPERGDVVIVTPPGGNEDYIKRVIGLPGDTIEVRDGRLILNGKPVRGEPRPPAMIPVDANAPCGIDQFCGPRRSQTDGGRISAGCRSSARRCPTASATTRSTTGQSARATISARSRVPAGHVFLMGDNRDHSADSRFSLAEQGLGGPVPWENIGGRAEFITFSLDGTTQLTNPSTWFSAFRDGRAGNSLRAAEGLGRMADEQPPAAAVEQPGPTDIRDPTVVARGAQGARSGSAWRCWSSAVIVLAQPILLIIGGMVFAVILDGGTRLLGRVLPIGRGWRLAIVTLAGFAFIGWIFYFAGTTLAGQAEELRDGDHRAGRSRCSAIWRRLGLMPEGGGLSQLRQPAARRRRPADHARSAPRSAPSASILMIMVIGIFIAIEPQALRARRRVDAADRASRRLLRDLSNKVGFTLRRLMPGGSSAWCSKASAPG